MLVRWGLRLLVFLPLASFCGCSPVGPIVLGVIALAGDGGGGGSSSGAEPLVAPTNVTAQGGTAQASISWDDTTPTAGSYRVYWSLSAGVTKLTGILGFDFGLGLHR